MAAATDFSNCKYSAEGMLWCNKNKQGIDPSEMLDSDARPVMCTDMSSCAAKESFTGGVSTMGISMLPTMMVMAHDVEHGSEAFASWP